MVLKMCAAHFEITGTRGRIVVHHWAVDDPRAAFLQSSLPRAA